MPESNPQSPPAEIKPNPTPPAATVKSKKPGEVDYSHVPLTEEFDDAKWTLPPVGIVAIGVLIIGVLVAAFAWVGRAKPGVAGSINDIGVAQMADNNVLVTIQISLWNPTAKSNFYIRNITGKIETADGKTLTDSAASPIDFERYFQAFPDLRVHSGDPLRLETKISPGGTARGTIVVSFPVTKEQFDQRKSISVIVEPYDQKSVTITK